MAVPAGAAKRDFGSFHASNVEELLRQPEELYVPPPIPVDLPTFSGTTQFGVRAKKDHFLLDDSWTFINHGAFGAVLKQGLTAASAWQEYCERQPLRFLDRELLPLLALTTRRLAKFIDAPPTDVALIPNVTAGANSVVRSLSRQFTTRDSLLIFNTTYGAVKKLVRTVSKEVGFKVIELAFSLSLSSQSQILTELEAGLDKHRSSIKLAVIDHISSNYGIIFPVKDIITLCHSRGIEVLVDGAHALGALPISMRDIGADYYVSNAHKWFCNPKGCGFLYVNSSLKEKLHPLVISHGYDSGFSSSFIWSGLKDYSPFLALNTVLDFWLSTGPDRIRDYIHTTAREAGEHLVKTWGTRLLTDDRSMFGGMVMVALPDNVGWVWSTEDLSWFKGPYDYSHAEIFQNILYHNYKIEVPVKVVEGRLYVRISAHIYNTRQDYEKLATVVTEISEKHKNLKTQ